MRRLSRTGIALALTALAAAVPARAVTLLYSNDVLGELEPCGCRSNPFGGLVRKSGLIEKLKKDGEKDFIQIDAGNLLFDAEEIPEALVPQWKVQSRFLLDGHAKLGPLIVAPGPKDLALGPDHLKKITPKSTTWLSINLENRGRRLFDGEKRIELPKGHLTVLGYSSPALLFPHGVRATDCTNQLKKMVEAAKARGDRVLVLSHQGLDADQELARRVPEMDYLLGANSQSFLTTPITVGRTRIFQSSFRNQYVGVLKLNSAGDFVSHELVGLDESYDALGTRAMKEHVARFKKEVAKTNATVRLTRESTPHGAAPYQTYASCFECHESQFNHWRKTSHAVALTPLKAQNQLQNLDCLRCHSVGQSEKYGYRTLAEIAKLKAGDKTSPWALDDVEEFHRELARAAKNDTPIKLVRTSTPVPMNQALQRIDRNFASVQCESCHGPAGAHPFEGSITKAVQQQTCLNCHTAERAPAWYKAGKLDASLFAKKLKLVACPKDHGDQDPGN